MSQKALKDAGTDPADAAHATQSDITAATARISAARKLLKGSDSGLVNFFDALFAGAPPEDVIRYSAESLAALATLVFERSAIRKPGETLTDILSFRASGDDDTRHESVLIAV